MSSSTTAPQCVEPLLSALASHRLSHLPPLYQRDIVPGRFEAGRQVNYYSVTEAAYAGRDVARLSEVFAKESAIRYNRPFAGFEKAEAVSSVALYADCGSPRFADFPRGLKKTAKRADYCLVASNEAGEAAGYIGFGLCIAPAFEADLQGSTKALTVRLNVELTDIYTRKRFRVKGAANAMVTYAGFAIQEGLSHLAHSLAPLAGEVETPVNITTRVSSAFRSQSWTKAHEKLVEVAAASAAAVRATHRSRFLEIGGVEDERLLPPPVARSL
ncbi:hypothetical protein F6X40_23740 [Paraburkholderia sp. UCT31]|uniref:hypothetical protein n=1 Tax=Paraburkholderia sp. UCT31 TaxID=2615209 RepID=UPI001655621F|nr:hypothetical protein [Paraburkholderia sp. UCT31]MBC8739729.1 hypothetical protein [Paraburkholderia sp. UCT31]